MQWNKPSMNRRKALPQYEKKHGFHQDLAPTNADESRKHVECNKEETISPLDISLKISLFQMQSEVYQELGNTFRHPIWEVDRKIQSGHT